MKRPLVILLNVALAMLIVSCGSSNDTVTVAKPRYHNSWPKKHRWHKKIKIWKFSFQMPERGGLKKVKFKN